VPPPPATDRNLLFGILALQMDFICRDALIAAMNAWVLDKAKPLGQVLCEQGKLAADEHALLVALVQKHLEKHGNDPERSLAAVSSIRSVRQDLQEIADPDVQASLVHVSAARSALDPDATRADMSSPAARRFQVLRPHARGGLGEVFVARDEELRREVALKEIQERHADNPESRARFLLEAEVTGGLEHPGIVPVYGLGTYGDGRPFYAMRFVKGDSLKHAVERFHEEKAALPAGERALRLRQLLGRFVDVCQAVAYAHSRGVLHRDLKPGNVMLGKYGETLVVDWGLAKVLGEAEVEVTEGLLVTSADSALTQAGRALGTPAYMSPEQAAGRLDQLGPRSDVYSLGATLYCLLTGQAPYPSGDAGEVLGKVQRGDCPRPRELDRHIHPALEAVCRKAMALRPDDRYPSPQALADDLEKHLADEPVSAYREPLPARLARWRRRHSTLVTATGLVLLTLIGAAVVGGLVVGREQERARAEQERVLVLAEVDALEDVGAAAVPALLKDLAAHQADALPRLRQHWEDGALTERQRLRIGLALADDAAVRRRLVAVARTADDPEDVLLVRDALTPHAEEVRPLLWEQAKAADTPAGERFQLLALLAGLDADNADWPALGPGALEQFLAANPLHLGSWKKALEPVRVALLPALGKAFRETAEADRRHLLATLLADYAADRPELLRELLLDADPRQYAVLFPKVQAQGEPAIAALTRELDRSLAPDWQDAPLDPAWGEADPALVRHVAAAEGLVGDRFALCQTLPLEQVDALAAGLRLAGYRLVQLRPYPVSTGAAVPAGPLQAALLWTRDGRAGQWAHGLTAAEVQQRDAEWRRQALVPLDVTAYLVASTAGAAEERYAVVWGPKDEGTVDTRLYLGVADGKPYQETRAALTKEGFRPRTQSYLLRGDQVRHSGVWWKPAQIGEQIDPVLGALETEYESELTPSNLQGDVRLLPPAPAAGSRQRFTAQVAQADAQLLKAEDPAARWQRAQALARLGRDAEALADLKLLAARVPQLPAEVYQVRTLVHARLGQADDARKDLAAFRRGGAASSAAYLDAVVAAYLGEDAAGFQRLEAALREHPRDANFLYDAACAHAQAAQAVGRHAPAQTRAAVVVGGVLSSLAAPGAVPALLPVPVASIEQQQQARAREHAERAVALLREAVAQGYSDYRHMAADADLDPIREQAGFVALLAAGGFDRRYAAVWQTSTAFVSEESHGLEPAAHLVRCRELAAAGWRPAALAVAAWASGGRTPAAAVRSASVWWRPVVAESAKDALAKRQAQAAVALLQLGAAERVWPLLEHQPDPRLRSFLIHRFEPLKTVVQTLLDQLAAERAVSRRRALLLSLGSYPVESLPAEARQAWLPRLRQWFGEEPDAGLHGAVEWLLRRWGDAAELARMDRELAGGRPREPSGAWRVNGQGQTLVVVPAGAEFWMGSPGNEAGRIAGNEPLHRVRIPRAYAIAAREVTVEQFQRFRPNHRYSAQYSARPDGPMIDVSWYDAAAYCNWLSDQEGIAKAQWCYVPNDRGAYGVGMRLAADYLHREGYRLPTEAEWEYACRAGAVTRRHYGDADELLGEYAWYNKTAGEAAHSAGLLKPNDLGLFDLYGNAWEWTQDPALVYRWPGGNKYKEDIEFNLDIQDGESRLLRGGAFDNPTAGVRSADRDSNRPGDVNNAAGFRVARTYP
jgi:formylglycine-generating enzyme required for sulfatase activity/tRNA A-37 threonylcarbamoyl transferase component Bud32